MSKRFNLREFQQQVLDRLQSQTAGDARQSALGIQLGQEYWLVDMTDISEVMPVPPLTTVPLTQSWYRGVANVRGTLHSIIDLNAYLRHESTAQDAHSRVLLLHPRFAFNAGFLVGRVLGLRDTAAWQPTEGCLRDATGQVWRQMDIPQILKQPEFLRIGR